VREMRENGKANCFGITNCQDKRRWHRGKDSVIGDWVEEQDEVYVEKRMGRKFEVEMGIGTFVMWRGFVGKEL